MTRTHKSTFLPSVRAQRAMGTVRVVAAMILAGSAAAQPFERTPVPLASPMPRDAAWALRLPREETVSYHGVGRFDRAGLRARDTAYPSPAGVMGLLVAIFTRGAMVEDMKARQRLEIQGGADQVLVPFRDVLDAYTNRELMQRGLQKVRPGGGVRLLEHRAAPGSQWWVESAPIFSMTQDQAAIVVDNVIVIHSPVNKEVPAYQNIVKIVSRPLEMGTDRTAYWLDHNGEHLKEESATVFAMSLELALAQASTDTAPAAEPSKTFHYSEGDEEKMETGQLVQVDCDRIVIRNVRGWLTSIPYPQARMLETLSSDATNPATVSIPAAPPAGDRLTHAAPGEVPAPLLSPGCDAKSASP